MDTLAAFAMGQASKGRELMVFDWDEAARIILAEKATEASAGLAGDWDWTGGDILSDGKPIPREDTYTYLASTWATPELQINGLRRDCYKMQSEVPEWDSGTYWPESALEILGAGVNAMPKELDEYDWKEAFAYTGNIKGALPDKQYDLTPFDRTDVESIAGLSLGENDGPSWMCYGKLRDGRWFFLEAGCDYTGWDCQAGGSATIAETQEECVQFALTDEARERLITK